MAKRKPVLPPPREAAGSTSSGRRAADTGQSRQQGRSKAPWAASPDSGSRRALATQPHEEEPHRTRKAHLRLVHIDPWSVMKTAFLLSIAIGIISVVAVTIIWGVLGAAGVWDSINSTVQQTVGSDTGTPFDITHYVGTGRVIGFTMLAAVIDVVLITAIATLGAFVYNLASTLIGGVEVTLAEDR